MVVILSYLTSQGHFLANIRVIFGSYMSSSLNINRSSLLFLTNKLSFLLVVTRGLPGIVRSLTEQVNSHQKNDDSSLCYDVIITYQKF